MDLRSFLFCFVLLHVTGFHSRSHSSSVMLLALFSLLILAFNCVDGAQVSQKYTKSPTGCACWFDLEGKILSPNSCACCKTGGRQCGYPIHNVCTKIGQKDRRTGCKGIKEWRYTLSEIGHPCSFDPTRNDCAWCTYDGFQCGNFTDLPSPSHEHGKYCKRFSKNHKQCYGTSQDCRNNPELCGPNASCVDTQKKLYDDWSRWSCACNPGFIGNGLTCVEKESGLILPEIREETDIEVILTTEFISVPDGPLPNGVLGPSDDDMLEDMEGMLDSGILCPGCNSTLATCDA